MRVRECTVDGCERTARKRGWCGPHYDRWLYKGDPGEAVIHPPGFQPGHKINVGNTFRAGSTHPPYPGAGLPHLWKGDDIGYGGAHDRVRAERGSASSHSCVDCGKQGAHWSYDRTDPNERVDPRGLAYSPDPQRYVPRCIPCHRAFDRELVSA